MVGVVLLRDKEEKEVRFPPETEVLDEGMGDLVPVMLDGGGLVAGKAIGLSETGEETSSSSSDHCKCKITFLVAH
jgi:hypothetical protein